jgi:MFS family permease
VDLLSTWHATPTFTLELNQWMRRVGWRWTIIINIALIAVFPWVLGKTAAIMLATASALMAWRNYQLAPSAIGFGQDQYRRAIESYYKTASTVVFVTAVFVKLLSFVVIGFMLFAVKAVDHSDRVWFIPGIAQGFLFFALFVATYECLRRVSLRQRT